MPFDPMPQVIVSLLALGMALAFIVADRNSPTSRALALFLVSISVTIAVGALVATPLHMRGTFYAWDGIFAIPETLAFVFAYEWVLRVRRTVPARNLNTRGPDMLLRVAQGLAVFYGLAALALPRQRIEHFIYLDWSGGAPPPLTFWLFAVPLALSLVLGILPVLIMFNRRPDRAEAMRLVSFAVAAPFMASGLVLPVHLAPLTTAIGLLIFLVGAVQFHVTQGRRAQFLSRFLAPQVAELVRERGLKSATEEKTLELSVVYCDLRGFTAFSAATSSQKVIEILRRYYDTVGDAAAAFGGTIKDQAGDGILILVGAPIPFEDHAQRALALARRIRDEGMAVTAQFSDAELQLGVGVGVASGFVTVGVIGAASRLEYVAVGPAVNLAARLCAEAAHGEVLVDQRTAELVSESSGLQAGALLSLKGLAQPVPSYVLAAA